MKTTNSGARIDTAAKIAAAEKRVEWLSGAAVELIELRSQAGERSCGALRVSLESSLWNLGDQVTAQARILVDIPWDLSYPSVVRQLARVARDLLELGDLLDTVYVGTKFVALERLLGQLEGDTA